MSGAIPRPPPLEHRHELHGYDQLNGPYDAKQIGDFTGLTPPFGY